MAMVGTAKDLVMAMAMVFSGHDDLFSPKVSTAKLRKQFKAANKRVDKAIARYKKALFPLYMPYYEGARQSDMSGRDGKFADVYLTCLRSDGSIRDYATDLSWTFYRRGRGGKFYEKPQPKREGFSERAWDNYTQAYQLVGQDYLDLRKLEVAIDAAVDEREILLSELESRGVNPYADAELWN